MIGGEKPARAGVCLGRRCSVASRTCETLGRPDLKTDRGNQEHHRRPAKQFDWVLCDSPAGIERGATLAMRYADEAVIVTNPEVSSVRDSDRIIGMLDSKTVKAERGERVEKHVLITRYDPARAAGEKCSASTISSRSWRRRCWNHFREPGRLARVERRIASYPEQRGLRASARLCRRRASLDGRNGHNDGSGRA